MLSSPFRMFRRFCFAACLLLLNLSSCRTPVPVWNDDGETLTDLRTLRYRGPQSVQLTPAVRLYADEIRYADKRKRSGEAVGRVFLDVAPSARYEWMIKHGYAGRAVFDKTRSYVSLADRPMLERDYLTQIGTEPYTTIDVRWNSGSADVIVRGPTRTDFAKSHPIPPAAVFRAVPVPEKPARSARPPATIHKR